MQSSSLCETSGAKLPRLSKMGGETKIVNGVVRHADFCE